MQRVKAVQPAEQHGAERRTRSRRSTTERRQTMNQFSTLLLVAGVLAIILATQTDMVRGRFREFQQCRRYRRWAEQHRQKSLMAVSAESLPECRPTGRGLATGWPGQLQPPG